MLAYSAIAFLIFFSFFVAMPHGMQDLSSLTRDQTCVPCSELQGSPHIANFLKSGFQSLLSY